MDSGAAKAIMPRDAIPGMKMSKPKGGSLRMANGNVIPNLGEAEIKGLGAVNSHPQQFGTQVAGVTKPLAAATEPVDGGRTIILHRTGGIVKKLSHELEKKTRDIIKAEMGPEVILERRGGAFTFDIDVKRWRDWKSVGDSKEDSEGAEQLWQSNGSGHGRQKHVRAIVGGRGGSHAVWSLPSR